MEFVDKNDNLWKKSDSAIVFHIWYFGNGFFQCCRATCCSYQNNGMNRSWSRFSLCLMGTKPPVYFKHHSWWSFGNMSHFYCEKHCCHCTVKHKSASQSTCETFFLLQTFYLLPAAGASNIALNFSLVSKRFAARMPKIDMECNIICTAMMVFADFFGHRLFFLKDCIILSFSWDYTNVTI